jgi:anti-sigma B factor antagonist
VELSLATRQGRGFIVVQVSGVLDLATTPELRSSLQHALDEGARAVVLDLTGVRFIDSTTLGMIAWLHTQVQERGGRVCVAATEPIVLRVLELTSMDRVIRIYDSSQAAEDDLATDGEP